MIEDVIFSKIYKKGYVKKLFENDIKMDKQFNSLLDLIKKCSDNNGQVHYYEAGNLIEIFSFDNHIVITDYTDDIENKAKSHMKSIINQPFFKDYNITLDDVDSFLGANFSSKTSYCAIMPLIKLQINKNDLNFALKCSAYIKSVNKPSLSVTELQTLVEKAYSAQRLFSSSTIDFMAKIEEINMTISNINDRLKNVKSVDESQRLKAYTQNETNVTTQTDIKEDGRVNISPKFSDKEQGEVKPYIYTNQIVTDGFPRTLSVMTACLIKNLENMKSKISSNTLYKVNVANFKHLVSEGRKPLTPEELARREEENKQLHAKIVEKIIQNKDYIKSTTEHMIDTYIDSIKKANDGIFNQDYLFSAGIAPSVSVYQSEILAPYVVAHLEGVWTSLHGKDAKKIFKEVLGIKGKDISNNCIIGFNTGITDGLADSYIFVRSDVNPNEWHKIYISSKGGLNGSGAAASLESLRAFIFQPDSSQLTSYGEVVMAMYPEEVKMLDFLTRTSFTQYKKDISIFNKALFNIKGRSVKPCKSAKEALIVLNKEFDFTGCILKVLQCASFEFMQVNSRPTSQTDEFHYNWTIQYPAVYVGEVKIEASNSGFTKFHIM